MSPTIRPDCPCPNVTCRRHTRCDECEAAQILKGGLPYCKRPVRSFWQRLRRFFHIRD